MTITTNIPVLASTVEDVSTQVALKGTSMVRMTMDPLPGGSQTVYRIVSGSDPKHAPLLRYTSQVTGKAQQQRRASISLDSWASQFNDITGETAWDPINAYIAFTVPNNSVITPDHVRLMLGNLYSYTYFGLTVKVPDNAWLNSLLFGVSSVK